MPATSSTRAASPAAINRGFPPAEAASMGRGVATEWAVTAMPPIVVPRIRAIGVSSPGEIVNKCRRHSPPPSTAILRSHCRPRLSPAPSDRHSALRLARLSDARNPMNANP